MGIGRTSGKCENKQFETNVDFSRVMQKMMKKIEVQSKERKRKKNNYKIKNYTTRLKKNQEKRRNEKKRKLKVCKGKENKIRLIALKKKNRLIITY